jgi:hypothetical protein
VAIAGGATILTLAQLMRGPGDTAGCPKPTTIGRLSNVTVTGAVELRPPAANPLVQGREAVRASCDEAPADARTSRATYALLVSERLGVAEPGKPVWVITYRDGEIRNVIVDALNGSVLLSYGGSQTSS